jgi:hypothetical protein
MSGSLAWVEAVLAEAQGQLSACRMLSSSHQATAHALLTLHLIASAGELPSAGVAGTLAAEANGPASRSWAVAKPVSDGGPMALYASTVYGRRFIPYARAMRAVSGVTSNPCVPPKC